MNKEIPLLTAADVELRVAQVQETKFGTYATLLVYKDARVDMKILDEVYGTMNWMRSHTIIDGKLFCTVSVWDEEKQQWISKQDVGVPSNSEATKGEASDAFKRACFNLGIGRELYAAPTIRIRLNDDEISTGSNGKPKTYAKFFVADNMSYDKEKNCYTSFTVVDKDGGVRFKLQDDVQSVKPQPTTTPPSFRNDTPNTRNEQPSRQQVQLCQECHTVIKSPQVLKYAMNRFGRPICYECQKHMAA